MIFTARLGAALLAAAAAGCAPAAAPPPETWTMRPGRWELQGVRHVWVEPDRHMLRVAVGRQVPGRWAWRDGRYVWEPARVVVVR